MRLPPRKGNPNKNFGGGYGVGTFYLAAPHHNTGLYEEVAAVSRFFLLKRCVKIFLEGLSLLRRRGLPAKADRARALSVSVYY